MFPCPLCKKVADDNIWATFKILKVQFEYDTTSSVITSVLIDLTQVGSSKPDARCEASFESTLDYLSLKHARGLNSSFFLFTSEPVSYLVSTEAQGDLI